MLKITMKAAAVRKFTKPLLIWSTPVISSGAGNLFTQAKSFGVGHTDLHAVGIVAAPGVWTAERQLDADLRRRAETHRGVTAFAASAKRRRQNTCRQNT